MISLEEYLASGQTTYSNLVLDNYRKIGLTNEEFLLWLQLFRYNEAGNHFPDLAMIASQLSFTQQEIYYLLNQLVQKQVVQIISTKDTSGKIVDHYDLSLIFNKIAVLKEQEKMTQTKKKEQEKIRELYQSFEAEFGRPLSQIEFQRIGQWLDEDHYQVELIQLALREAVLNQAYSLNYIDRILLSWERKNIRTSQQVQEEQKRRKRQLMQKEAPKEKQLPKISLHNWLEED
ncbi:DnaD domain protein [Enterococcus lemanii]|uniref:DnaD domain protein n=1 Tax=Enterococcus lemanii TaxID=1159752 RepID=A0ABV9MUQ0_9ENTE|nr:DnaD domain protein [Enterococcus lemanii]MBM7709191.1 DNA replication protein [Enterococcus lemanii]NLM65603.1 DnaD domain protein [Enterococcus sp.]